MAFFKLQMEVELDHALENMTGSFGLGFGVWEGNEEVVHVDDKPSFSNHVLEQVTHESLECSGGVAEAKEHDHWFKESFVGDEGYLPLMTIFYTDVVVTPTNIKLGEVSGIFELILEVGDEGKGVCVMSGMLVEVAVVLARAEFAILLFDKKEEGGLE